MTHHVGNPYDHAHESGDHDLAADPPGDPDGLRRLDVLVRPADRRAGPGADARLRRADRHVAIDLGSTHLLAMGASILIATVGIGLAVALLRPARCPISSSAGSSPGRRPSGSAASTTSWSTSGTSTSCMTPPSSGRPWRWPGSGRVRQARHRRHRQRLGGLTVIQSKLDGALRQSGGRRPGEPDRPGSVYGVGDWGRTIQTGRLRNYLMFLAVALVGLFAGVFAWVRG